MRLKMIANYGRLADGSAQFKKDEVYEVNDELLRNVLLGSGKAVPVVANPSTENAMRNPAGEKRTRKPSTKKGE